MKKNPAFVLFTAIQLTAVFSGHSQTAAVNSFTPLDIDKDNRILFNISEGLSSSTPFDSLFLTDIEEKPSDAMPSMLTAYPEQMEMLDGNSTVQIRNRYGNARFNTKKNSVEWSMNQEKMSSAYSHTPPASASPDGKWLCVLRPTENASAVIILQNTANGKEIVLSEICENEYDKIPVKWAPDSKTVLYEKNNVVYFATPDSMFRSVGLSEEMRVIGSGSINCVSWTNDKNILYVHDDIIYKIYENELYNRAMYAPLVGYGTIIARLPYLFDSQKDKLYSAQDGKSFVTVNGQNIVTYFSCGQQGFYFANVNAMFLIPANDGSVVDSTVFWTSDKKPVLWVESMEYENGGKICHAYSIDKNPSLRVQVKNAGLPKVSPDGKKIAFAFDTGFSVYDISSWKKTAGYDAQKISSFCWKNSSTIILGGSKRITEWNISNSRENFLFLSSAQSACFADDKVLASDGNKWYEYVPETCTWRETASTGKKQSQTVTNGRYRAYSTSTSINIRALSGNMQTYPLFAYDAQTKKAAKKIAIVFDAMENADGLAKVLSDINKFGIKTTFFINGEFIRRYPLETKQLASTGIECASSFYSSADLLSPAFRIDESFIKRGLARNEDEFLAATGKELSLLWHAPDYKDNEMMRKAGNESGYTYVDASPVNVSESSSSIIEDVVSSLKNGKIISITIGKNTGNENTYLTEHLDLLLSTILNAGWEICPVQELLP
ncbi:MAG: polysaccharide deacetylase family protein [Treponema sp.]|nr:polysaccharide deacetylase family protein [Treponema sp.]